MKYYDADLDNKKYRVKDLVKLVRACKEKKLKNLSAWREYGRKFITIGGWLLKKNKISNEEYATYYWNGIPKVLRIKLENRLLAKDPVRSLANPFGVDEINSAAEALLQRDRFDMNFAGSDEEDDSDEEGESDDESSDSESEDELKTMRRRVRKRARFAKHKSSASDSEDSDDERPARTLKPRAAKDLKRKINGKDEPEVETLIKQLNTMAIDDPGYAALVFRALKLDPDVMRVVRPPVFVSRPTVPDSPQFPRTTHAFSTFRPRSPPHMAPNFQAPRPFNRNMTEEDRDRCYGCGSRAHRMGTCRDLQELVARNKITRNDVGRYVYTDGRPIRRFPGESLVNAVERDIRETVGAKNESNTAGSHLIRVVEQRDEGLTEGAYYANLDSDTSESDDEGDSCIENVVSAAVLERDNDEEVFGFTYPVTRTERTMSAKRREAMEAEYQQPKIRKQGGRTKNEGSKENTRETGKAIESPIRSLPTPPRMQVPVPIGRNEGGGRETTRDNERTRVPVPVEVRRPEYDGRDDNVIMEDTSDRRAPPQKHEAREASGKNKPRGEIPLAPQAIEKFPRQSELASQARPLGILNQMLNTRIDLAIGEVLGISRELSSMLGDKIKPRSTKPLVPIAASLPIATSFYTKNRGLLIQLHMQCEGRPITAIIDTGSQLNIVSKSICESKILRPVDNRQKISIADANGGQGKLEGMVANVPLSCGEVATMANLYVGTHVPFELLLGRPWQRGNFVSIDERRNGTYLLFKDPKSLEARYEILVSGDRINPEVQYEIPVWDVPDSAVLLTYQVTIKEEPKISEPLNDGPTTRLIVPKKEVSPFLNFDNSTMDLHTSAIYPPFQNSSISFQTGANIVESQPLIYHPDYEANGIKTMQESCEPLPEHAFHFPHSMTSGLQYIKTEAQPGSTILPLSTQPLFRLDSEVLLAALADAPFLRRTNNLHPLLLSTADGILLGNTTDPNGQQHNDYVFLHAGLFDLSSPPYTVTPASAFVRIYPQLADGPPQPWLLPYISSPPPSEIMVSLYPPDFSRLADRADDLIFMLKQFRETNVKTAPSTHKRLPSPIAAELAAPGVTVLDSYKLATASAETPLPQLLPGTEVSSESTPASAPICENVSTDSFFSTNRLSTLSTNIPRPSNPIPPTPKNSSDEEAISEISVDYSSMSPEVYSSAGSDSDAYGEMDMDVETDNESSAEMMSEYHDAEDCVLNNKYSALDRLRADIGKISDDELKKIRLSNANADQENAGVRPKLSKYVYNRLFASYYQVTGEEPSESTMIALQNSYITLLERGIVPFVPREVPKRPSITRIDSEDSAGVKSPKLTPVSNQVILRNSPATSSPLVNNPPHPFLSPEPATVFLLHEVADETTMPVDKTPTIPYLSLDATENVEEDKSTRVIINISTAFPAASEAVYTTSTSTSHEVEMVSPTAEPGSESTKASGGLLVPTEPSSPVISEREEHSNRLQHTRKVGKDELIANLQLEANYLRKQLDAAEATEAAIHKNYYDRLSETVEKIRAMEAERVGELDVHCVFLAGLMYIMHQAEALTLPLPHNSPPMVPTRVPPESVAESLANELQDFDSPGIEQHCPVRGEKPVVTYNQLDEDRIPQCPNQPLQTLDPRSIPIASRPYFQGGANDFIKRAGGVKRHLYVDLRSLSIVEDPTHVPAAFLRHFTELYGPLEPFIFPGRLAPVYDWPLDVPETKAVNYKERIEELRIARREAESIYQSTTRTLTKSQIAECLRPHITLHKRIADGSPQLSPIKVDRIYFWSRLHPNWNPLLKPIEATFLRGAIYTYYGTGQIDKAEELERLLRTPHFDDWEVRELVSMGALDSEFRESEALIYFQGLDDEHWEFHANEEAFRNAATSILDVMDDMENAKDSGKAEETDRGNDAVLVCDPCNRTDCAGFPLNAV